MDNDNYEEVYRSYYKQGVTDGLPVIPPTDRRVDEMFEGTDLAPDAELTRLGDRQGLLTVEKIAVNGVMAGCIPIHMPVLVAGAKALSDPSSAILEAAIGTDSSGHYYLLSGPIRQELDINAGTGAFGPGFRSNQTIGQALGLALKNTAKIQPGEQAMGVLGNPFKNSMVTGETEENSPWASFYVDRGYDPNESTITLINVNSVPHKAG